MQRDYLHITLFSFKCSNFSSLKTHFKLLENLKKKDPPILTYDEIITATEEVERLIHFLKEDTAAAKVTITFIHNL